MKILKILASFQTRTFQSARRKYLTYLLMANLGMAPALAPIAMASDANTVDRAQRILTRFTDDSENLNQIIGNVFLNHFPAFFDKLNELDRIASELESSGLLTPERKEYLTAKQMETAGNFLRVLSENHSELTSSLSEFNWFVVSSRSELADISEIFANNAFDIQNSEMLQEFDAIFAKMEQKISEQERMLPDTPEFDLLQEEIDAYTDYLNELAGEIEDAQNLFAIEQENHDAMGASLAIFADVRDLNKDYSSWVNELLLYLDSVLSPVKGGGLNLNTEKLQQLVDLMKTRSTLMGRMNDVLPRNSLKKGARIGKLDTYGKSNRDRLRFLNNRREKLEAND